MLLRNRVEIGGKNVAAPSGGFLRLRRLTRGGRAEERSRYIHAIDEADRDKPLDYLRLILACVERSLNQYLDA